MSGRVPSKEFKWHLLPLFVTLSDEKAVSEAHRTYAASEVELFVILAAFGLLYVTESSVLGAVRVLHVLRHFIIIIIIIIIVIIIIIINIIFILLLLLGY